MSNIDRASRAGRAETLDIRRGSDDDDIPGEATSSRTREEPSRFAMWEAYTQLVQRHPHREALVVRSTGCRLSFAQLAAEAADLQREVPVLPEDRVGVWMGNCEAWVVCMLATARAGAVFVPIALAYTPGEARHVMKSTGITTLVSTHP